jgi:hypothetical protein
MLSANAFRNSFSERNPHVTPTESTHARLAVSMSTAESPMNKVSDLGVGHAVSISNTIEGSGFVGMPSSWPNMAANLMSGK